MKNILVYYRFINSYEKYIDYIRTKISRQAYNKVEAIYRCRGMRKKGEIKVIINYPKSEIGMKNFEEKQVDGALKILLNNRGK